MQELIRNAWLGWQNYTDNGKLAALFLAALLILWLGGNGLCKNAGKKAGKGLSAFYLYTGIMAVCCICPLTAAVLMKYQTRFYDYQWIWNAVPVTIIIAFAGTLLYTRILEKYAKQKGRWWKSVGITALFLAVIYLCGKMRNDVWDAEAESRKLEQTREVLEIITENGQNTDICLWAPQEILEYARALDGQIRLPYGRNMWDKALNAYAYDTYGETEKILYAWMEYAAETGEGELLLETGADTAGDGSVDIPDAGESGGEPDWEETQQEIAVSAISCADMALQLGVNGILLPGNLQPEVLAELEEHLGLSAEKVEGYYYFCFR